MKQAKVRRGVVYVCPVCGAEVTALADAAGTFHPRCCNVDMVARKARIRFFRCPLCGAEVAVLRSGKGVFAPRCCNTDMVRVAA